MSCRTYICTRCHSARRAEAAGGLKTDLRCAGCSGPLWELSPMCRVPRKSDTKSWKKLAEAVCRSAPAMESFIRRRGRELLRQIDRETEAFSAHEPSSLREETLKDLKKERERVLKRYAVGGYTLE